jgi:acetate kinase
MWDEGVRRYGFHGLSYEYVVGALGAGRLGRAVVAHLGNGASMVAVRDGRSVDTTMGFTPTGGLVMSTRSGDLDPGIAVYLLREKGYDAGRLEQVVDREAGLVALSGGTSDMQSLLEQRGRDPGAALAVDAFCYQARKHVGALAAVLGGLDTLVFTGGIGEKAAAVRSEICHGLGHLGVELDDERNTGHADVISAESSDCEVRVVRTDEDLVIVRHTVALVRG